MGFKDQIAKDIGTMINVNEFGDLHNINGNEIISIVDESLGKERFDKTSPQYIDGVFLSRVVVFVKSSDIAQKPIVGELFRLDGKRYVVVSTDEVAGIIEIEAELNQS